MTPGLLSELRRLAHTPFTDADSSAWKTKINEALLRATVDTLAAGYIGIRYGRELVSSNDAILPPASLFGLLSEIRSGPMNGLRIYWDEIPKVSRSIAGEEMSFTSNRVLLGWAFMLPLPWLNLKLEGTPKIGVWSMKANLPFEETPGLFTVVPLEIKNALSLGGEIGLEAQIHAELVRLWYERNAAVRAFGQKLPGAVDSSRTGLDLFIEGPRLGSASSPFNLSFLLFALRESLTMTGSAGGQELPFAHATGYAGGGISFAW